MCHGQKLDSHWAQTSARCNRGLTIFWLSHIFCKTTLVWDVWEANACTLYAPVTMELLVRLASWLSCRWVVMMLFCTEGFWGTIAWWELASGVLTSCQRNVLVTSRLATWFVRLMTSGSMWCRSAIRLCSCKRLTLLLDVSLEGRGVLPALVCRLVVISFGLICFLELCRLLWELCRRLTFPLSLRLQLIGRTFVWWQTIIHLECVGGPDDWEQLPEKLVSLLRDNQVVDACSGLSSSRL